MKRRITGATVLASLFAVTCTGCIKRTQLTITLAADGGGTATLVTVFDRNEVEALAQRGIDRFLQVVEQSVGAKVRMPERGSSTELLEAMRREGLARAKGLELIALTYREDVEGAEILETVEVRFAVWEALHRWIDPCATHRMDSARLLREKDGTWLYEQTGFAFARALPYVALLGAGPPQPARESPVAVAVQFPGAVLEADAKAEVEGSRVAWRLDGEIGQQSTPYRLRVRFAGTRRFRPFRLTEEDFKQVLNELIEHGSAAAEEQDPGTGPLDGSGWSEAPDDFQIIEPLAEYAPPKGSVSIEGRVVHRGKPVAGATVRFALQRDDGRYGGTAAARTDEGGAYRFPGLLPATYSVEVQVGGSAASLPSVRVPDVEHVRHDVALGDHEMVVRVVDGAGVPQEGAEVFMPPDGWACSSYLLPTTGPDGIARVPFVGTGPATFSAALGGATCDSVTVDVPPAGPSGPVTIRASGFGTVIVQVLDADGRAAPAYVGYRHPTAPIPNVASSTDRSGRAVFRISPGRWLVGLSTTKYARNHDERFRQFAREVAIEDGTTHTVVLVKPRR